MSHLRILLSLLMVLGMFCAGAGCAKKAPAGGGMQDIVPENGIGPDGTPVADVWNGTDTVNTPGSGNTEDSQGSASGSGNGNAQGAQETARVGKLTLTLPKGFSEATTGGLYLNQDYPDDSSNIYIYTTEKTTDFEQVMSGGREQFIAFLADAYEEQYEERPEITLSRYEAVSVGNYPAYAAELSYDLKGVHYAQLEYIVDAEKTYYIAFSQVGAGTWMEAFYASAQTMFFSEAE